MSRPTMADLARTAGVSFSTVDRVLNGRDAVRPETAQRVLEAAEQIGFYATSLLRQRLRTDVPERTLGFLLQQRSTAFYKILGDALTTATRASSAIRGRPIVEFMDDLTPGAVADRLERLGDKADAVAVVAADHPLVSRALDRLHAKGVPVIALVSDLTAETRTGYVGLDNRKVGRTAGWFVTGLADRPGKVAIFVGSHRYLCQETCEIGFRSYLRENAPAFELIEPITTLESEHYAYENTLDLLRRSPDLVGIYVAGGGAEGVLRALTENGACNRAGNRIVTVCLDLTDHTRTGLIDGIVQAVISHPLELLADRAVDLMARHACRADERDQFSQVIVPFEIFTPESV
jgi:LacI family transcriptional regulator